MVVCLCAAKRDRTCACIVSHTYKQIRKLWDNADKVNTNPKTLRMLGKFDADIDRSTSSDTGAVPAEYWSSFAEDIVVLQRRDKQQYLNSVELL